MLLPPPSEDDRYAELLRRVQNLETALRSAFTTISGGAGIQIIDGGKLALVAPDGTVLFYIGPVSPDLPDGSPQPGWSVRRADGTLVLSLRDAFPGVDGTLNQALTWFDRSGHIVISDDTDSGFGHARPWLSNGFAARLFGNFRYSTAATDWETVADALVNRQQPRMEVGLRASMDTAGTTGQLRVLVNGDQLGPVTDEAFVITTRYYGPAVVTGPYGEDVLVEIQGKRTSGTGALRVEPRFARGRQS